MGGGGGVGGGGSPLPRSALCPGASWKQKAGGGQTERTTGFLDGSRKIPEGVSVPHATTEDDKPLDPNLQQSAIPARPAAVAPKVLAKCKVRVNVLGPVPGVDVPHG
jgi:hypothetical protein